jgi:hypothetical protein
LLRGGGVAVEAGFAGCTLETEEKEPRRVLAGEALGANRGRVSGYPVDRDTTVAFFAPVIVVSWTRASSGI